MPLITLGVVICLLLLAVLAYIITTSAVPWEVIFTALLILTLPFYILVTTATWVLDSFKYIITEATLPEPHALRYSYQDPWYGCFIDDLIEAFEDAVSWDEWPETVILGGKHIFHLVCAVGFVATLVYLGRRANAVEPLSAQQEGLTMPELLVKERENSAKKVQHVKGQSSEALQRLQASEAERSRLEALNEGLLQKNIVLRSRCSSAADDLNESRSELRLCQESRDIADGLISELASNKLRVQARGDRKHQTPLKAMNVNKHLQARRMSTSPTNAFRPKRPSVSRASTGADLKAILASKDQTNLELQQNYAEFVNELEKANVELKGEIQSISDRHHGVQLRLDDQTAAVADRDRAIFALRKASKDAEDRAKKESHTKQGLGNELDKINIELQELRCIHAECGKTVQGLTRINAQIQHESAGWQAQVSCGGIEITNASNIIENQRKDIQILEANLQTAVQEAKLKTAANNESIVLQLDQNATIHRQTQEINDLQNALQRIKETEGPKQRELEGRLRHQIRLELESTISSSINAEHSHRITQFKRILEEQQAELISLKTARRDSSNKSRMELDARDSRLKEQQSNLDLRETNVKVREHAVGNVGPVIGVHGCDHAKQICVHDNAVFERKIDGLNRELANQKRVAQKASGTLRSLTKRCDESEKEASKLRQERKDLQTRQSGMDKLGASHESRLAAQERRIKELEEKNAELQQNLDCGKDKIITQGTDPVDDDVDQLARGVANLATTQPDGELVMGDEAEGPDPADDSPAARQKAMQLKVARMGKQPMREEVAEQTAEPEESLSDDGFDKEEVAKAVQASLQVDDEAGKDEDKPSSSKSSTVSLQPSPLSASSVEPAPSHGSGGAAAQTTSRPVPTRTPRPLLPPSPMRDASEDSLLMPPPLPSILKMADNRNTYGKRSRCEDEEEGLSKDTTKDGKEKEKGKKVRWGIARTEIDLPKKL